jgi:hypothetical protein
VLLSALDRPPRPHTPSVHQPNAPMLKGETVMDHVKIEIGLGRFEAFTIIGPQHDSSLHDSVAAALVWLSGQFIASVMTTEIEVPDCTAAIFDADTEEVTVQWHGSSDELADLLDRLAK